MWKYAWPVCEVSLITYQREKKSKHRLHAVCLHRNTSSKNNGKDLYLVQADEGGNTDVLFFEEGNTFLSCVNGVHHDVVQGSTTRGNSHVILLIYGSQVSLKKNNYSFEKNTCGLVLSWRSIWT